MAGGYCLANVGWYPCNAASQSQHADFGHFEGSSKPYPIMP